MPSSLDPWWYWQCYKCVTRVVFLALAVLQLWHAGGIAGTRYKGVTRVALLALAVVLQIMMMIRSLFGH